MRIDRLHLRNFLSYRDATLELGDLTALVGPNASGKSNAVAALRFLRDIPLYGLQAAISRTGGFEHLRHRSDGGLLDPTLRLEFRVAPECPMSWYELALASTPGGGYRVEVERGEFFSGEQALLSFSRRRNKLSVGPNPLIAGTQRQELPSVPESQSVLPMVGTLWGMPIWTLLHTLQLVEIDPAKIREIQDASPADSFEADGSNAAICFEELSEAARSEVVDQLSAVIPAVERIEPRHLDDKITLRFHLKLEGRVQEFSARQMSDGTLRVFGTLVALAQPRHPSMVVIEEPETAIHLGALRTLVEIFRAYAQDFQILLTTHSADILDALGLDDLRVVWWENGSSHIGVVAEHMRAVVKDGLITPGELLRSFALDHAVA